MFLVQNSYDFSSDSEQKPKSLLAPLGSGPAVSLTSSPTVLPAPTGLGLSHTRRGPLP